MYKPRGVKEVYEILKESEEILIYYDPDVDGLLSGFMFEKIVRSIKKSYSVYINENREHGFNLSEEKKEGLRGKTVVVVDALMSRGEVEELVKEYGINIINIDHHENYESSLIKVEEKGVRGVVINNQYSFEPKEERYLSGAGMVYYVMRWIHPKLEEKYREDWRSLVGISLLSDVREIENEGARGFLRSLYGLESSLSKYILESFKSVYDYGFGERRLDRNFIDYTFAPVLNAMFRLNRGYDAIEYIRGNSENLGNIEKYRKVQKRVQELLEEELKIKEYSHLIYGELKECGYETEYARSTFVGLLASKQKNKGKTTLIVLKNERGEVIRGSVRGMYDNVNYQEICSKYGLECAGHTNAFGVKGEIKEEKLEELNKSIKEKELKAECNKYEGRVKEVSNMSFYSMKEGVKDGKENTYVRGNKRVVIKYKGEINNIKKRVSKSGKRVEYEIDGVPVISFDGEKDIRKAVIEPIEERCRYTQYYIREE